MKVKQELIRHAAPTLSAALDGPFAGTAVDFMINRLGGGRAADGINNEEAINELLGDPNNLQKIKEIDRQFKLEAGRLGIDALAPDTAERRSSGIRAKPDYRHQTLITIFFLSAYFLMLAAIFAVEASDSMNMQKGENSLMNELQILLGVLTAGVGQILSFWFGGVLGKKSPAN